MSMKLLQFGLAALATVFIAPSGPLRAGQMPATRKSYELFLIKSIPDVRIEISPEGMEILRHYEICQ